MSVIYDNFLSDEYVEENLECFFSTSPAYGSLEIYKLLDQEEINNKQKHIKQDYILRLQMDIVMKDIIIRHQKKLLETYTEKEKNNKFYVDFYETLTS